MREMSGRSFLGVLMLGRGVVDFVEDEVRVGGVSE